VCRRIQARPETLLPFDFCLLTFDLPFKALAANRAARVLPCVPRIGGGDFFNGSMAREAVVSKFQPTKIWVCLVILGLVAGSPGRASLRN
jgi:hypothetical protein